MANESNPDDNDNLRSFDTPSEKLDPRVYFLAYSLSVKVLMDEIFLEIGKTKKARNSTVTHLVFWFKMCLKKPGCR